MDISIVFAWMMQYGVAIEHFYKFVGDKQNYVQLQPVRFFFLSLFAIFKINKSKKIKIKNNIG